MFLLIWVSERLDKLLINFIRKLSRKFKSRLKSHLHYQWFPAAIHSRNQQLSLSSLRWHFSRDFQALHSNSCRSKCGDENFLSASSLTFSFSIHWSELWNFSPSPSAAEKLSSYVKYLWMKSSDLIMAHTEKKEVNDSPAHVCCWLTLTHCCALWLFCCVVEICR